MSVEQEPFDVIRPAGSGANSGISYKGPSPLILVLGTIFLIAIALAVGYEGGNYLEDNGLLPGFLSPNTVEEVESAPEPEPIVLEETTITRETVEEALAPASELATLTYKYKNASSVKNVKKVASFDVPFTLSKTVFTYTGTIKIGFDLSEIDIVIDNENKVITLNMPAFGILSSEIDTDSFEFVSEQTSIFNPIDMSEYTEALNALKQETNQQVLDDEEFMTQAQKNAEAVLTGFLRAAGIDPSYEIVFAY